MLPEGKCPQCGSHYCGWALKLPRHQMCPVCGMSLEITEDGRHFFSGYSPFTAEEYKIITQPDLRNSEFKIFKDPGARGKGYDNDSE
jgi:hypothetical protein